MGAPNHPNGVALSPDGKKLYAAETPTGRLCSWDIVEPGVVAATTHTGSSGVPTTRPLATLVYSAPAGYRFDSMAVDGDGNICVATLGDGPVGCVPQTNHACGQALLAAPHRHAQIPPRPSTEASLGHVKHGLTRASSCVRPCVFLAGRWGRAACRSSDPTARCTRSSRRATTTPPTSPLVGRTTALLSSRSAAAASSSRWTGIVAARVSVGVWVQETSYSAPDRRARLSCPILYVYAPGYAPTWVQATAATTRSASVCRSPSGPTTRASTHESAPPGRLWSLLASQWSIVRGWQRGRVPHDSVFQR